MGAKTTLNTIQNRLLDFRWETEDGRKKILAVVLMELDELNQDDFADIDIREHKTEIKNILTKLKDRTLEHEKIEDAHTFMSECVKDLIAHLI